jgi:hypothetical protein
LGFHFNFFLLSFFLFRISDGIFVNPQDGSELSCAALDAVALGGAISETNCGFLPTLVTDCGCQPITSTDNSTSNTTSNTTNNTNTNTTGGEGTTTTNTNTTGTSNETATNDGNTNATTTTGNTTSATNETATTDNTTTTNTTTGGGENPPCNVCGEGNEIGNP